MAPLAPADLDPEQQEVYRSIAGGPRASGPQAFALTDADGRLNGPFDAMLRSPTVGAALQALGGAIRYGSVLSARARELAILAVAAAEDSSFERYAHEAVARTIGLTEADLAAVRAGSAVAGADVEETVVLDTARVLLARADLDDDEYARALGTLGERGLVELTALIGYYRTLALQLRVFGVGVPSGA